MIKKIHDMLCSKKISCTELTQNYLNNIKKNNNDLNCYVNITESNALESAKKVDNKIKNNQEINILEGIPMTLKDNISTENLKTTCCSKILENYVPIYNSTVWNNLHKNNSVLLGKTNMDEFAMGSSCETSYFGAAKNPHNLNHVPGGSSGGAASAVAGNLAVFGLGSDTGGSVRQPASFCGVVGLKPTYGSVSRYGLIAYASSFDQIGPIAKSVEDISIIFDNISYYDPKDSTSSQILKNNKTNTYENLNKNIKDIKIGVPREYYNYNNYNSIDPEIKSSLENSMKIYESLGAHIEYFDFPEIKYTLPVYYILACAEAASNLSRFDGVRYGFRTENYQNINEMICKTRSQGFGKEVKRRIMLGNYVLSSGYYDAYYKRAQDMRNKITQKFEENFEKYDVLLTPTSPVTAFELNKNYSTPEEIYLSDICTVPVNITGVPAISVPCGFDHNNLPIGMQLITKKFGESKLLNIAHQFEINTNFEFSKNLNMGVNICEL
ncbi:MAG: Asp-tRNA(Asn)/Glu-tRNA(Gln) amidotransferase subunit GatA [Clostridia bacterium]|nr:Asp-tRNA(Asn)/Glu-tRNA(Gln) amidotransferase subunit GatA [Clostridia bacterium]